MEAGRRQHPDAVEMVSGAVLCTRALRTQLRDKALTACVCRLRPPPPSWPALPALSQNGFINSGVPRGAITVLPHGVDTSTFHPLAQQERAALRVRMGWQGRFVFLVRSITVAHPNHRRSNRHWHRHDHRHRHRPTTIDDALCNNWFVHCNCLTTDGHACC